MENILRLIDYLRISLQMLKAHKLRSLLSVVGIVFGIVTLLATLAIGEGARRKIMKTVEAMGANLVYISPQAVLQNDNHFDYRVLTLSESRRLDQMQGVLAYSPVLASAVMFRLQDEERVVGVEGVLPTYLIVRDLALEKGRLMTHADLSINSRIAVLGHDLAQKLFPNTSPLGQTIHLLESSFKVVGVLAKKGKAVGADFDGQILVPLTTLQEILGRQGEIHAIWVRAQDSSYTKDIMFQARTLLARTDIEIWDQETLLAKKDRITKAFKWALGAIALISLVIGGIGVMNVLLASVAERVKEIGIRKAVGANSLDILFQFVFESLVLTGMGALIGIILGMGLPDLVAWTLNAWVPSSEKWEAAFSWSAVGVALHFTFWVGFVFGLYPAWKASRLDPCEALMYH